MISLRDVLTGTQGELARPGDTTLILRHVRHDSRQIGPGDLFVAVPGEQFDGHEFVPDAFAAGAAAAIVDAAHAPALSEQPGVLVVVDDPVAALQRLAAYWRSLFNVAVVGITGSVGKSSTKELIASVLSQRFRTVKSRASFNNEIGLPLSLLEITPDTEAVVLEMGGGYAFGEIEELCRIAQPRIGVVTNVSHSHLERMGSVEAIARTKAELPAALPEDGLAVLNGDDERVRAMAGLCRCAVWLYGLAPDCVVRARDVRSHGLAGISFWLNLDGVEHHVKVPLLGRHSAHTVLAGLAAGRFLGMSIDEMLPAFNDPAIQLRLLTVPGLAGSIIIDDTYNASPTSTIAALNLLADLDASRRIAVLGDMLELGAYEDEGHRIVGRRAAEVVDRIFTCGPRARLIAAEARRAGLPESAVLAFDEKRELIEALQGTLKAGDVVLVKGSRGMRMEEVVDQIRSRKAQE